MYSMIGYEKCIYVTPCGYCSKFDKWCEKKCGENKKSNITITTPISKDNSFDDKIKFGGLSKEDFKIEN